jgi:hypothetical protein
MSPAGYIICAHRRGDGQGGGGAGAAGPPRQRGRT